MSEDLYAIARWEKVGRQGLDLTHAARAENNVAPRHAIPDGPAPKVLFNAAPPSVTFKNFVLDTYDEAVRTGKVHRPRKDQILVIEGLLTCSPEFFRPGAKGAAGTYTDESVRILVERGMTFLRNCHGEHLIRVELQLDEVTPHLQYGFFPIDARGRWSAKDCMKRGHLLALWDGWADAMKDFGLKRGLKGSAGRHEPIKLYYDAINRFEAEDLKVEGLLTLSPPVIPRPSKLGIKHPEEYARQVNTLLTDWAKKEMARIQESLRPTIAAASSTGLAKRRSGTDRKTTARALKKTAALEKEVMVLRAQVQPPVTVAAVRQKLGYRNSVDPKLRLDTIAYLEQVEGLDLDPALGWLTATFGVPAAAATIAEIFRANTLARASVLPIPKVRTLSEIEQTLEAQLSSLRADSLRVVVRDRAQGAGKARPVKRAGAKTNEWSIEDVIRVLPELKMRSASQDIRIEPVSAVFDYVVVGGMGSPDALEALGLQPCCVLQVAKDRFEAVLRIPTEVDADEKIALLQEVRNALECVIEVVGINKALPIAGLMSTVRTIPTPEDAPGSFRVELVAANDVDFIKPPGMPPEFGRP